MSYTYRDKGRAPKTATQAGGLSLPTYVIASLRAQHRQRLLLWNGHARQSEGLQI